MVERMVCGSGKAGDRVLYPFAGSGSTLIICENKSHHARLIELDLKHVVVVMLRWQGWTGKIAVHAITGLAFPPPDPLIDFGHTPEKDAPVPQPRLR